MNESEINNRFDEINAKLDMVLQYVEIQRRKSQEIEDLVDDVKIVGYDMYNTVVEELDHNNIELNPDELKMLVLSVITSYSIHYTKLYETVPDNQLSLSSSDRNH